MKRPTFYLIERIIMILMILGMVGMFQPFIGALFGYSFMLLLFSTIGFIIISHMTPQ